MASLQQLHLNGVYLRKIEVGEIIADYVLTHEQKVDIFRVNAQLNGSLL